MHIGASRTMRVHHTVFVLYHKKKTDFSFSFFVKPPIRKFNAEKLHITFMSASDKNEISFHFRVIA